MSPQPKWRVSAERLIPLRSPSGIAFSTGTPPSIIRDLAADNIDAHAEIDTLQAAVRELRELVKRQINEVHYGVTWTECHNVLARTDKLLPEDE